ncbi:MAG: DNA repair protein RecO [Clostridia bacterium]|nr:DNA repair protein RecO [Clostridia bacterium]
MRHKVKGIVLREIPKGETSKLLTVLTSGLGVITVNAKGVRKLTSPYLKCAQTFAFSEMLLYEKNGFFTLTEAALIADFYSIREDIKGYSLACYLCEVATAFAVPGDESVNILRLLLNSLYAIENKLSPLRLIKAGFELRICAECGFMPEAECCADCGEQLGAGEFIFRIFEGVSLCRACGTKDRDDIILPFSVGRAIKHITESDMSRFLSFRIGESEQAILADLAERFMLSRAERGFKTLSFYKHCEELQ